jgi:hypothetical protein
VGEVEMEPVGRGSAVWLGREQRSVGSFLHPVRELKKIPFIVVRLRFELKLSHLQSRRFTA